MADDVSGGGSGGDLGGSSGGDLGGASGGDLGGDAAGSAASGETSEGPADAAAIAEIAEISEDTGNKPAENADAEKIGFADIKEDVPQNTSEPTKENEENEKIPEDTGEADAKKNAEAADAAAVAEIAEDTGNKTSENAKKENSEVGELEEDVDNDSTKGSLSNDSDSAGKAEVPEDVEKTDADGENKKTEDAAAENKVTEDAETGESPDDQVDPMDVEDEYNSTPRERLNQTPKNLEDGGNGNWEGERGDSKFSSQLPEVQAEYEKYGVDGVEYKDNFPDFSPVSIYEHTLPAELHTAGDDVQFRDSSVAFAQHVENNPEMERAFEGEQLLKIYNGDKPSGYTWHHGVEAGKMQLVSTRIHTNSGHYGGKNIWGGGSSNR